MTNEIKEGSRVTIHSIHHTRDFHGLDDNGEMESMVGKVFVVARSYDDRVYIKSDQNTDTDYVWCLADILPVDDTEPDPIIFKFDEKQLIV
jgi:hypothetical protein